MADQEALSVANLTAKVNAQTTVIQGTTTLLSELSTLIRDNVDDSDALNALADTLDANTSALAAAVTANTPTAPNPPADTGTGDANTQTGVTGVDQPPIESPGGGIEPQVPAPGASTDGQGGVLSTDGSSSATGGAGPTVNEV